MEEKKIDIQSIIGFILIGGILIWMLYSNSLEQPTEEKNTPATTEEVTTTKNSDSQLANQNNTAGPATDSAAVAQAQSRLGAFGYSATLASAEDNTTVIENDVLRLEVANKGGYIEEAVLKNYKTFDSIPVYLVKDGNAKFNLNFTTTDGRTLDTENLYFEPSISQNGDNQVLSMKLKVSNSEFLEYRYAIKPGDLRRSARPWAVLAAYK